MIKLNKTSLAIHQQIFIFLLLPVALFGQPEKHNYTVSPVDYGIFTSDKYWQGADGALTIDLGNGRLLWLFSDTFINPDGKKSRSGSRMINNTVAIQNGYDPAKADISFFFRGTNRKPESFFDVPGDTWFWTGHGAIAQGKLIIFLFEEAKSDKGLGFETKGWYVAVIDNPEKTPDKWKVKYYRGQYNNGIIPGSSAVLKQEDHLLVYGVREPGNHDVYLLRFSISDLLSGRVNKPEWWNGKGWTANEAELNDSAVLFSGQTEFSVTYSGQLQKYIEIQTYGFGDASIGYRLAGCPEGPWSEPVIVFTPTLNDKGEFVYTARAHPELVSDGLLITYNINNFDFTKLVNNMDIYFPKLLKIIFW